MVLASAEPAAAVAVAAAEAAAWAPSGQPPLALDVAPAAASGEPAQAALCCGVSVLVGDPPDSVLLDGDPPEKDDRHPRASGFPAGRSAFVLPPSGMFEARSIMSAGSQRVIRALPPAAGGACIGNACTGLSPHVDG